MLALTVCVFSDVLKDVRKDTICSELNTQSADLDVYLQQKRGARMRVCVRASVYICVCVSQNSNDIHIVKTLVSNLL